MAQIKLVTRKNLTETDLGISLNLAIEYAPVISKILKKPYIPIIKQLDEFYQDALLKPKPEGISNIIQGYTLSAAYKSIIKAAELDVLYVFNMTAKEPKDMYTYIPQKDITIELLFKEILFIYNIALKKRM